MDPEILPGSGSGIIVPDPAKYEKQINKNVTVFLYEFWTVCSVYCRTGR